MHRRMSMPCKRRSLFSLTLSIASSMTLCLLAPLTPAGAQITPDRTLGAERSFVTPNVNINNIPSDRIDGGAIRGTSLFHSFGEFNIDAGRGVYFTNPAGIENILSRITGINPSHIQGTLGVLGSANLFLINPNGIIFGPSSRLELQGSFVASTANSMVFNNGYQFSATNPSAPPLLTINVPVGLQYGMQQPAAIVNTGNLGVQPGQSLTLVGGSVATNGKLTAAGGQISIAAVPSESMVQLDQSGRVLSVSPVANPQSKTPLALSLAELLNTVGYDTGMTVTPDNQVELKGSGTRVSAQAGTAIVSGTLDASNPAVGQTGGTVQVLGSRVGLFDRAGINVSGDAGGGTALIGGNYQGQGILPQATATYIGRDVTINADAVRAGNGGQIVAWANQSTQAYGTLSARGGAVAGKGGLIETSSLNFLSVSGIKVDATAANGLSGTWLIDPRNIIIQNAATANGTFSGANPNVFTPSGDDAVVSTQDIETQLNAGTNVTITTGSTGNQEGNITVADSITKSTGGAATLTLQAANTITLNSAVEITSNSDALNLFLLADSDRSGTGDVVMSNAKIKANGGHIGITANSVLLENGADVHSDANGNRNGGSITLNAHSATFRQSGMGSDTFSEGNAGQIIINADIVSFEDYSGLSTDTYGSGNAGQIKINAGSLSVNTGGFGTNTLGSGNAGQIIINANAIALENSGMGTATDGSGNAGQIDVTAGSIWLKNSALTSDTYRDGNAGQINIKAGSISLTDGSVFATNTTGSGKGGQVTINANSLAVTGAASIDSKSEGSGDAGQVTINADVVSFAEGSALNTNTYGSGNAGQIRLNVGSLSLNHGGFGSSTYERGNAGQIIIHANTISLVNQSGIGTATYGSGNAGRIDVTAGSVSLKNSALTSVTETDGNAGQINVEAGSISLTDLSAFASNRTGDGKGNGGQVTVKANSVVITSGAGIFTTTEGSGAAGQINVTADSVLLQNGALSSQTSSTGNGGQINVTADSVMIEGSRFGNSTDSDGSVQSGDVTLRVGISTNSSSSGKGGDVTLNVGKLIVRDGAAVAVNSSSSGDAGTLTVVGDSIRLDTDASLNASTVSGLGGNINLKAQDIQMRRGSNITTNATGSANGGNITIDTGVLIALENSDISANSTDARGGNVEIAAQGIFGTKFRPTLTPESDITATGANSSLSGTVDINIYGIDPTRGLEALPETLVDPTALIGQNPCERGKSSSFVVMGRGGLPSNPSDALSSDAVWTDWRTMDAIASRYAIAPSTQHHGSSEQATPSPPSTAAPLVEAQGWVFNDKGEVVLTAHNPTSTFSQTPWVNPAGCRAP